MEWKKGSRITRVGHCHGCNQKTKHVFKISEDYVAGKPYPLVYTCQECGTFGEGINTINDNGRCDACGDIPGD